MWAITDGVPPFWEYAMEEGCTVDAAAIQVIMDLEAAHEGRRRMGLVSICRQCLAHPCQVG